MKYIPSPLALLNGKEYGKKYLIVMYHPVKSKVDFKGGYIRLGAQVAENFKKEGYNYISFFFEKDGVIQIKGSAFSAPGNFKIVQRTRNQNDMVVKVGELSLLIFAVLMKHRNLPVIPSKVSCNLILRGGNFYMYPSDYVVQDI